MVPETLHLRNFLSHRETDLDFRGIHLASLIGENGAGKSALLDAMTWAIWGRSRASYGHEDDLVYHGESGLEVEFVFRISYQGGDERRCRILRRRERRGRRAVSSVLDFQMETEGGWQVLTGGSIRETQQRIIRYLGLDYETFVNSAYLRQGHADEFTVQPPAQRKQVLSAVLGLARWSEYRDMVRDRLSELSGRLAELDRRLDEASTLIAQRPAYEQALSEAEMRAEALDTELQLAQLQVDGMTRLHEQMRALQRRLDEVTHGYEKAEAEVARLQSEVEAHREVLSHYQSLVAKAESIEADYRVYQAALAEERRLGQKLGQVASLRERVRKYEAEISAARDSLDQAIRALEREENRLQRVIDGARAGLMQSLGEVRTQVEVLAERIPDEDLLARLDHAKRALSALEEVASELDRKRTLLQKNEVEQSRVAERNRQLRDLEDEVNARLGTLMEAQAVCPLCKQPLSDEHRQKVLAEIRAQAQAIAEEFQANGARIKALQRTRNDIKAQIRELERQLQARPAHEQAMARLQQRIEQGEEARHRLSELQEQIAELELQLEQGAYAISEREALSRVIEEKVGYQAQLSSEEFALEARAALAEVVAELSALGYDADAHEAAKRRVDELVGADGRFRELEKARLGVKSETEILRNLEAQVQSHRERVAEFVGVRTQTLKELSDLELQLKDESKLVRHLNEVRQRAAKARQRVGAARQDLAALETWERRFESMHEQRDMLARRIAILSELREAFGVNGIPAMIIEHTLPGLEREANHILQQLTGGRMHVRFETQRETKSGNLRETLDIIISDEKGTRPYEAFSGGEKFRINFAIRVALSRLLSQRAGVRLRSLFVDEGFGALDTDGRQRLIEAIKAVQSDFDMILIITHIDELREVFPTQIQVIKTDSGSQVEIV